MQFTQNQQQKIDFTVFNIMMFGEGSKRSVELEVANKKLEIVNLSSRFQDSILRKRIAVCKVDIKLYQAVLAKLN